ncbi:hypothetical protein ACFQH6_15780 [Halobacteriaceae archaeon GCM10025711]
MLYANIRRGGGREDVEVGFVTHHLCGVVSLVLAGVLVSGAYSFVVAGTLWLGPLSSTAVVMVFFLLWAVAWEVVEVAWEQVFVPTLLG